MTITTTSSQIQYTGDGASLAFAFPTPFIATSDIKVYLNGVLQTSGYSVAGFATIGGSGTFPSGTVTFVAAPAIGVVVLLVCDPDQLQSTSLPPNDPFPSKTVEKMIDKVTLLIQRLYGKFGNAITFPPGDTASGVLPSASLRALQTLSFDASGNVVTSMPAAGTATALAANLLNPANTFGADMIGGVGRVVNTIAALRLLLKTGVGKAFVLGYYTAGDGGGGQYWYDSTDAVSTDNGGTIIVASDGGRWKLANTGTVSVKQFGAKGDGSNDDTTAIQTPTTLGLAVYFPVPSGFYRTTAAINMGYSPRWTGERGAGSIIRRTNGAGSVLDFAATNEYGVIENLRIGGIGSTGITVAGGGYANYLSTLSLRNVHFEADLLTCINANLIHCNFIDCTFGYFQQTSVNGGLQHVISVFNGANNTNINKFDNCKFFNGSTTAAAVTFTGGLLLTFINCAWENNGRDLQTSNVQDVRIISGYTERGKHATSQFEFGAARTGVRIDGMQANGSSMPAGASMFRAPTATPLVLKECDVGTTASAFGYQDINTSAHFPTSLHDILTDNRWQGNAADPLLPWDNVRTGVPVAFTPTANGFTIVNGTGGVTHAGRFSVVGRTFKWQIVSTVTGTATIAAPGGGSTNYFDGFPTNVTPIRDTFGVTDDSATVINGSGLSYVNGRHYPPPFSARNLSVTYSGTFQF